MVDHLAKRMRSISRAEQLTAFCILRDSTATILQSDGWIAWECFIKRRSPNDDAAFFAPSQRSLSYLALLTPISLQHSATMSQYGQGPQFSQNYDQQQYQQPYQQQQYGQASCTCTDEAQSSQTDSNSSTRIWPAVPSADATSPHRTASIRCWHVPRR